MKISYGDKSFSFHNHLGEDCPAVSCRTQEQKARGEQYIPWYAIRS